MKRAITIELASLTKQEFDFASSKVTTKEINDVINEIEESNASYGITAEDIIPIFVIGKTNGTRYKFA